MRTDQVKLVTLMGMAAGTTGAIQALESLGNETHRQPSDKPTSALIPAPSSPDDLTILQGWGIKYKKPPPCTKQWDRRGQELLVEASLPPGWAVVATNHYLYKDLRDPRGQTRAQIMVHYQDNDSWLALQPKYRASHWSRNYGRDVPNHPCIFDSNGCPVWTDKAAQGDCLQANEAAQHKMEELALYPGGSTPEFLANAYFDAPFDFPPSPFTIPDLKVYSLSTTFYHPGSGSVADSGGSSLNAADDAEAIGLFQDRDYLGGYEIVAVLYDPTGKEIGRRDTRRPKVHIQRYGFDGYGDLVDAYNGFGRRY